MERMRKKFTFIAVAIFTIAGLVMIIFATMGYSDHQKDNALTYKEDFYYQALKEEKPFLGKVFSFAGNQLAQIVMPGKEKIFAKVPFKRQEHPITCEVAALRMALNYLGINVTEEELIEELVFDTREPKSYRNIWGDPDNGFVGDVNGSVFLGTGYGVYEKPIFDLALRYRDAAIIEQATLSKVLSEVKEGNPVIVWGLLNNKNLMTWRTRKGKEVEAYPGEHTRVVMGYTGTISNPNSIILMDTLYGKISMSKAQFLADWKKLENRAVVVY